MAQYGASIFNEDRSESLLNSPESIEAFTMMQAMVWEHEVGSPQAGSIDPAYAQADFVQEQTSIMTGMNWMEPTLEGQPIEDHYKVVPLPQKEGGVKAAFAYAWHWAVNAQSDYQDEAWKFIDFLSSNQVLWYENSKFIQPRNPEWMSTPEAEAVKTPYFDLFADAMSYAVTGEYITNYTDYYQVVWKAFQEIMYNNADVEATLNNAKAELDAAIALW
jgi:ABC-type glycerol-3-phosphate transport system substrate-binding protein